MPLTVTQGPPAAVSGPPGDRSGWLPPRQAGLFHPGSVLCANLGPLRVWAWLLVPPTFLCTVLGLGGLGLVLPVAGDAVHPDWSVLFGAAAGLNAVFAGSVAWTRPWSPRWLSWPYGLVLITCALTVGDLPVPTSAALGCAAAAVVSWVLLLAGRRPCPTDGGEADRCSRPEVVSGAG